MSYNKNKHLSLTDSNLDVLSIDELKETARKVLDRGMYGLCFSAYEKGQKPGDILSEEQIRRRMKLIAPYTKWIRSFSCLEGNECIPKIAKEYGINTMVGVWLGTDTTQNEKEIKAMIKLASEGYVNIAAVGNEVMYRGDLSEISLIDYIVKVKEQVANIPVGYVDAYYEFSDRPAITEVCDVILSNCYPFWEGCHQSYSLLYMKDMYRKAQEAGKGKKVIISETGWPVQGSNLNGAEPSYENALKYFINTQNWAYEENVELFYFSSFDEAWKESTEGDVGGFWGLWNEQEKLKF